LFDQELIVWWAHAMCTAVGKLFEMRQFLGGSDPVMLEQNNTFRQKRGELESAMAEVIRKNKSSFDDP
jgi:hypothetical protein